jgi:hypothetical protein
MVGGDDSGEKRYIEVEFRVQTPMWGLLTYVSRKLVHPACQLCHLQWPLSLCSSYCRSSLLASVLPTPQSNGLTAVYMQDKPQF